MLAVPPWPLMKIVRLDHLVLTVRSIPRSVDFYTRVMGMTAVTFGEGRTALAFGEQKINLHPSGREFAPHARKPVAGSADLCFITTASLRAVIARLQREGVPVLEGPVPRTGALGPMSSVYFRDPDGNLIEVATYSRPRG
jgi:catechol 2,3-dioxygenase-like lactoylglutathione lyase family enzyme